MNKIKSVCSNCGAAFQVPAEYLGRRIKCPKCQNPFMVSQAEAPAVQPPPPPPGRTPGFTAQPGPAAGAVVDFFGRPVESSSPPPAAGQTADAFSRPPGNPAPPPPDDVPFSLRSQLPDRHNRDADKPISPAYRQALKEVGTSSIASSKAVLTGATTINTTCPRCDYTFAVSDKYTNQIMSCPGCKRTFYVVNGLGLTEDPTGSSLSRVFDNKRLMAMWAGGFALLVILLIFTPSMLNAMRVSRLTKTMHQTYPAPNYEISVLPDRKLESTTHKNASGEKSCRKIGHVVVFHHPTGLGFRREMCLANDGWSSTYRQTISDQMSLELLEGGEKMDMATALGTIFDFESKSRGQMYASADISDETMGRISARMAMERMTIFRPPTGAADEADSPFNDTIEDDAYDKTAARPDGDQTQTEWATSFLGSLGGNRPEGDVSSYALFDYFGPQAPYIAHAVMFPDQASGLMAAGRIDEMP